MRLIDLSHGKDVALVDDVDYDYLVQFTWHLVRAESKYTGREFKYATRIIVDGDRHHSLKMHIDLMAPPEGLVVDHRDRNGLNNQRSNLRWATQEQNGYNKGPAEGKRFKGVHYRQDLRKWNASIRYKGQGLCLGFYATEEEAALAYDKTATVLQGEFAYLNFPNSDYSGISITPEHWLENKRSRRGSTFNALLDVDYNPSIKQEQETQ